jgi:predicted Fe-S protein YdhL (DUF1289 family)
MKSPCNKVCKIEKTSGLCIGCLRTKEEIAGWPSMTDEQKWWVLDDIALVRSQAYNFVLDDATLYII